MSQSFTGLLVLGSLFAGFADADSVRKNVVLILADDLGWSDTTLYGTTELYRTPNIARLAERGMLFMRAYSSSPLCSPTRASVLTGLSPARHGITAPQCHLPQVNLAPTARASAAENQPATAVDSVTRLDPKHYTLAEALRDKGYATAHFGKWHLGSEPYSPLEHGFDLDIPHWHGPGPSGSYVAPWKYPDFDPQTPNEHIEDRMAEEAREFIVANKDRPFFVNYWMFSVHAPFDAKKDLIDKYRGVVDPNDPQRSPTYAAMIESMDDAVGTLLDTLDENGLSENTIIVFASDNGGNMYNEIDGTTPTSNAPLKGGKATMYEGGIRGPAIVAMPGEVEAGATSDQVIQSSDFYPTLLELLAIEPQEKQHFDGISIVPALVGGELEREAIFTYFPHNPPVPDWLPPSVSVHAGDWKLIRLFHAGLNGMHRWKLFNLKEDIGEANDLSDEHPEILARLDQMIEEHLLECGAVRPLPNPNFDPTKYRIEDEGVGRMKRPKQTSLGKPVLGWRPGGTTRLKAVEGRVQITSTGGDPYLSRRLSKRVQAGETVSVRVTFSSKSEGHAELFWKEGNVKTPFTEARRTPFQPIHDGDVRTYEVSLTPDKPLVELRLDPSRAPGTMELHGLEVVGASGDVVESWGNVD